MTEGVLVTAVVLLDVRVGVEVLVCVIVTDGVEVTNPVGLTVAVTGAVPVVEGLIVRLGVHVAEAVEEVVPDSVLVAVKVRDGV